jgi:hypothetical protein
VHSFYVMGAVLHAFAAAVLAFFILFAASKAEGFVRLLGNLLGWVLLIGVVAGLAFGIYGAATGQHPPWLDRGHMGWMMRGSDDEQTPSTPGAPATPQTTPPRP